MSAHETVNFRVAGLHVTSGVKVPVRSKFPNYFENTAFLSMQCTQITYFLLTVSVRRRCIHRDIVQGVVA